MRKLLLSLFVVAALLTSFSVVAEEPPQAAVDACASQGQVAGYSCSFTGRQGKTLTGTCVAGRGQNASLVCRPQFEPPPAGCAQIPCAGDLAKHPFSAGLLIGATSMTYIGNNFNGSNVSVEFGYFGMEIPFEYTFVVGPGNLVAHVAFKLDARADSVVISIPMGARYKMQFFKFPLYFYPIFDIGPAFEVKAGNKPIFGMIRFGAGVSYLVLPYLEVMLEPLGLGAFFNGDFSGFEYTFLAGAQFRF